VRFASLGSGSEGNALIVEVAPDTRVMLDCGFALKECERRLARLGLEAEGLAAIIVTHEHSDHLSGVLRLARRYALPVYATRGTLLGVVPRDLEGVEVRTIRAGSPFDIGALAITPFAVPHDAREPVQFVLAHGARRLGVLTDVGRATPHVIAMLSGCDALVLECNHDRALLERCEYPSSLKARIRGAYGHLDNEESARLLEALDRSRLGVVVAAHLSRRNNTVELARAALARVLGCAADAIPVADQDAGLPWIVVAD
jgi:phosphoribosyl 1,2-cyclic phosphodiesterase